MVRYALLRPLRPELDAKTKTCLADGELSSRLDEQAINQFIRRKCVLKSSNFCQTPNTLIIY
jgi:hypothetical protein